jgi:hypothetical protein
MKYKVTALRHQSARDHAKCVNWLIENVGKRGQAWTVVWVNGYIYGLRKESYAVLFALTFVK